MTLKRTFAVLRVGFDLDMDESGEDVGDVNEEDAEAPGRELHYEEGEPHQPERQGDHLRPPQIELPPRIALQLAAFRLWSSTIRGGSRIQDSGFRVQG